MKAFVEATTASHLNQEEYSAPAENWHGLLHCELFALKCRAERSVTVVEERNKDIAQNEPVNRSWRRPLNGSVDSAISARVYRQWRG